MNIKVLCWSLPALVAVAGGALPTMASQSASSALGFAARTSVVAQSDERPAQIVAQISNTEPYAFSVETSNGVITLSGGYPDEASHSDILKLAGPGAKDEMRLLAGVPDRASWLAAVSYALKVVADLGQGRAELKNLTLAISGTARTPVAFSELTRLAQAELPNGVSVTRAIEPATASPYVWHAKFDGHAVTITGFAPHADFGAVLAAMAPGGVTVSSSLVAASGAPDGFAAKARAMFENLMKLEQGSADLSDGTSRIEGSSGDATVVAAVEASAKLLGAELTLDPPLVADYQLVAGKQDGKLVVTGFVPDQAELDRISGISGVDASGLKLGRGAPDDYDAAVEFVLGALGHMTEGKASIDGTSLSLEGRGASPIDYVALETTLQLGAPQGYVLAKGELHPPIASPYVWTAEKAADGVVTLSGDVPSAEVRRSLLAAMPGGSDETMTPADGAPDGFEASARAGLKLLAMLDSGNVGFDGTAWKIAGSVKTHEAGEAAEAAFAAAALDKQGWSYDVDAPAAPVAAIVRPYLWSAEKTEDGLVHLSGYVPTADLKATLAEQAKQVAEDTTLVGSGEPSGFIADAEAGLDALLELKSGKVVYDGTTWRLAGLPATASDASAVEAALGHGSNGGKDWSTTLLPPADAPAAAEQQPAAVPTAPVTPSVAEQTPAAPTAPETPAVAEQTPVTPAAPVTQQPTTPDVTAAVGTQPPVAPAAQQPPAPAAVQLEVAPITPAPATVAEIEPVNSPGAATATHDYRFEAKKDVGGVVSFAGAVPEAPVSAALASVIGSKKPPQLTVDATLPPDFAASADAGTRALVALADGEFGLDGDKWVLIGRATTDAELQAALTGLKEIPGAANWQTDVTVMPPMLACQTKVGAFAKRNAILFAAGKAVITPDSMKAIDELAADLTICPDTEVDVEGYTDSDGDADINLALSVARAEAVVAELTQRGIDANRLYSVGYGESLPVAKNDTAAGKKANRRIGFTIRAEGSDAN